MKVLKIDAIATSIVWPRWRMKLHFRNELIGDLK